MRILADENIPLLDEFFGAFGSIRRMPGRAMDRAAVGEADILIVRSITPVTRALLEGSPVRFVGTCTIGTDHLDIDYLESAGIAWSSAPGCNARGVVDYVLGALLALSDARGVSLSERTYGVVGAGQVGGRLVEVLKGLNLNVLVCDPPRALSAPDDFVSLETVMEKCDVISLHAPLVRSGPDATYHLFDAERLAGLKAGTWLINACRGEVIDNKALRECLVEGADLEVVLDVWESEPEVDIELAKRCRLATPHIAGHSLEGKWRGTAMVYAAFCAWQEKMPEKALEDFLPEQWLSKIELSASATPEQALRLLCRAVYDPRNDDAAFRLSLKGDTQTRRNGFDLLRKHYPQRREITGLRVYTDASPATSRIVEALGATRL
ncbi:4-phosphoerythronate dehydrogenase PdxB [Pseudomonas luteola]|uniref:4-phosphoerythronate dehydrogenase PdxB n=1 Tax=Pseudomonas luteola TaxID=47886 RepID=UPI00123C3722|nr:MULTISPECIES: 4-phosphoerythronate dehydrogenase PdxB [Pseudomonas]MBA1250059.1 4-phosphoerythronate dehydrogenase PdxB [Pseudomonas zeshuii]QEU28652.1 4-phosphoerythronate dehydrogenase PdxB [Pseudomonas luteola]